MTSNDDNFKRGTRRKKIAGYLIAANDIRQSYQQSYTKKWESRVELSSLKIKNPPESSTAGFKYSSDANEELVLFPSYAKRLSGIASGSNSYHHNQGLEIKSTSDIEKIIDKSLLEESRIDSGQAIVDIDVRGWIYVPHKGPMNRRLRLLLGLVRQFSGIPVPTELNTEKSPEPGPVGPEKSELLAVQGRDYERIALGEQYMKGQIPEFHDDLIVGDAENSSENKILCTSIKIPNGVKEKPPWKQPSDMSQDELKIAHLNLMTRLSPFMANPLASIPVDILFYNKDTSVMKTVYTNEHGHFVLQTVLDFIPTNIKALSPNGLSVEEEARITEPRGVSLISDIDDTIKYTSIGSGAREVFLNTFVRDLDDLKIDGVKEWYNSMYDTGVHIHYVSNSPWQLFPTLRNFFRGAGLPPGSYHLKHYSGMFQGIMEPVSERKKPTINKILSDFPERYFILVGDSGEADLEVYSDIVLANPGRILMVLIRDLTQDFFDSASIPRGGRISKNNVLPPEPPTKNRIPAAVPQLPEKDPVKCANTPIKILPRKTSGPTMGNLIDVGSDENSIEIKGLYTKSQPKLENRARPPRPPKPAALRAPPCATSPQISSTVRKNIVPSPKPRTSNNSLKNSQASLRQQIQDLNEHLYDDDNCGASVDFSATSSSLHGKRFDQMGRCSQSSKSEFSPKLEHPPGSLPGNLSESLNTNTRKGYLSSHSSDNSDEIYQSERLPVNKKLDLWRRRWKKAKQILESRGVILKAWKVGSDVSEETIQVIREKMTECENLNDTQTKRHS